MKGTRADDRDIVIDNKNFSRCQEGERKRKARNKTSFCSAKKIMQSTNREKSHVREQRGTGKKCSLQSKKKNNRKSSGE